MSRMLFVNLPVQDLTRSVDFFAGLGFELNEQFTDERATCMVVGDQAFVMLLAEPFFATFTTKDVVDSHQATGSIIAVSASSREEVDTLADRALATGGTFANEPSDEGLMYGAASSTRTGTRGSCYGWTRLRSSSTGVAGLRAHRLHGAVTRTARDRNIGGSHSSHTLCRGGWPCCGECVRRCRTVPVHWPR